MQRDWGNDLTHLLHVNGQNANTVDMVNDEVHARLQNDLNEMQTRQTVLVRTVAAMEEHLAQSSYDEKEQETGTPQLPSGPRRDDSLTHLPDDLMGETGTDRERPRPSMRDSVASSPIPTTSKGQGVNLPPWETTSKFVTSRVTGTGPEYTSDSRAVPSPRMMSDMGPTGNTTAGTLFPGTSGTAAVAGPGVGQMKLDAPPRYSGGRRPSVRVWLSQMERYMRLMRYPNTDWLDIIAMRVDGTASSWMNAQLAMIERGQRPQFADWDDFRARR